MLWDGYTSCLLLRQRQEVFQFVTSECIFGDYRSWSASAALNDRSEASSTIDHCEKSSALMSMRFLNDKRKAVLSFGLIICSLLV